MLNKNDFYELFFDANRALLSAALFYWSKTLAYKLNAWAARCYERFPALRALPGSRNAGTQWNYKITYIWFRICSAVWFISTVFFSIVHLMQL
jgi:hypothetical protein